MAEVKWIKIVTDIFDNRKIRQIEALPERDSILVIWFKLLCLAGDTNDGGQIYFTEDIPYTDEMLASQFNRPLNTIRLALEIFERFGMVEIVDNILLLPAWEKYQAADKLEKIREQNKARKQRQRERQRGILGASESVARDSHVTVTHCHATDIEEEIDIETEEEKEYKKKSAEVGAAPPLKRFQKPTVEEVATYCRQRGNKIDPQHFYDFYESKGWRIGNQPMKDWRACVRTWEKREGEGKKEPDVTQTRGSSFNRSDFMTAALRKSYGDLDD